MKNTILKKKLGSVVLKVELSIRNSVFILGQIFLIRTSVLFVGLIISTSVCARVLIPANTVSPAAFRIFQRLHAEDQTMSKALLDKLPRPDLKENFIERFSLAKQAQLSGQRQTALRMFEDLAHEAIEQDWGPDLRPLLFDSLLMTALLTDKIPNRILFLIEAQKFAPENWVTQNQWPAWLLKDYKVARTRYLQQIRSVVWNHAPIATGGTILLMNGRTIQLDTFEKLRIPPGENRMTFLSDFYRAVGFVGNVKNIGSFQPSRIPLVEGTCQDPKLDSSIRNIHALIYFSDDCIYEQQSDGDLKKWSEANTRANLDLVPSQYFQMRDRWPEPLRQSESVFKKPIFWAAIATGIAVAAVQASAQKN